MSYIVENVSIHIKYAQYYMMIYNCTVKSYEQKIPTIEIIFLSSLMLLRNGFVLATNIWISIFQ